MTKVLLQKRWPLDWYYHGIDVYEDVQFYDLGSYMVGLMARGITEEDIFEGKYRLVFLTEEENTEQDYSKDFPIHSRLYIIQKEEPITRCSRIVWKTTNTPEVFCSLIRAKTHRDECKRKNPGRYRIVEITIEIDGVEKRE